MTSMVVQRVIRHQLEQQIDLLVLPLQYEFGAFKKDVHSYKQQVNALKDIIINQSYNTEDLQLIYTHILNIYSIPADLSICLFNSLVTMFYQEFIIQQSTIYKTINTQKYIAQMLQCVVEIQKRTYQEQKQFDKVFTQSIKLLIIMVVYLFKLLIKLYYQTHCISNEQNRMQIDISQKLMQYFSLSNKPEFKLKYFEELSFRLTKLNPIEQECLKYILITFQSILSNSSEYECLNYSKIEGIQSIVYSICNAEYELFLDEYHDYALVNYQNIIDHRDLSADQLKLIMCKGNNVLIYYLSQYSYSCCTMKILNIWSKKIIENIIFILESQLLYFGNMQYNIGDADIQEAQLQLNARQKQLKNINNLQDNQNQFQYNEYQYTSILITSNLLIINPELIVQLLFIDNTKYINKIVNITMHIYNLLGKDLQYIMCLLTNLKLNNIIHNKFVETLKIYIPNLVLSTTQGDLD